MSEVDTFTTVKSAIINATGNESAEITLDSELGTLGLDSLDTVGIVMDVEEALDIQIDDEQMPELVHTVGDLVKTIDGIRAATRLGDAP